MTIYEKLSEIQNELEVPKSQYNSFGKYNYRSAEDILSAAKPVCKKHNTVLVIRDDIVEIGGRVYVKAIATLFDLDPVNDVNDRIMVTAYAREADNKKGMDEAQVTGATSSYARKYALNGLFNLDDTKDADTDAYTSQTKKAKTTTRKKQNKTVSVKQATEIEDLINKSGVSFDDVKDYYGISDLSQMTIEQYESAKKFIKEAMGDA